MNKFLTIGVALVLVLAAIGYYLASKSNPWTPPDKQTTTFDECVAAGYPVMESYPEQCRTPNGQTFVRDVGNTNEILDIVQVTNPMPGHSITSPLAITGQARGTWYFEATFPIELRDENDAIVGQTFATADGEWMTEEFVPFTAELEFPTPQTPTGTLVIQNANPSGLAENEKSLSIPVVF